MAPPDTETLAPAATTASPLSAPRPAQRPKDVSVHGDTRIDPYFWLRERDNPEVLEHLRAENAHSEAWFAPLKPLRETLYAEMLGRIQEDDQSVPYRKGRWWYATRTEQGKAYPVYLRREGSPDGPEQTLLDMNALAEGQPFLQVGTMAVSPDGRWLAYALDHNGSLDFTLRVKDIATGEHSALVVADRARGAVWANDSRTLYVLTHDDAKRTSCVWRHRIDEPGPGERVYEDRNGLFWVGLDKTLDTRWIVIHCDSADTTELRVLSADRPRPRMRIVLPRRKGREASLAHRNGRFYLRINDTGPNFRLISVDAERPDLQAAEELLPHRETVMIEDIDVFAHHLVVSERDGGVQKLWVHRFDDGLGRHIAFDETVYSTHTTHNAEFDTRSLRLAFTSLTTPNSVYACDLDTLALTLLKQTPVLGGFDRAHYAARQLWARARDGTAVPVSLVWRRDLHEAAQAAGRSQPLLLDGYGAYGISNDVYFSSARLSLLDRGVIMALAHVRGGCDLGRQWYLNGKLQHKQHSFSDFIACAEALIADGLTTPSQLIIEGGSAGGLLMGAVMNQRPDLFKAVVAEVPFVDMLNTMLDDTLPLTTGEYLEWGNPNRKADYACMRAYSPYDNLHPAPYPAILLRTSLHDSQVPYWEAAKFAARLRDVQQASADLAPVLLHINLDAGHGGASGRYEALRERAQVFAFMLRQWGLHACA